MSKTNIEWADETWNPTTGCTPISQGCSGCYAKPMSLRCQAMGLKKYKNGFTLTLHEEELLRPYTWKKSKIVFVDSMSDLFHKGVPLAFIKRVFKAMNETPHITYLVLTKRANILAENSKELIWSDNIYMGVSIEDVKVIDRLENLKKSGAKVKFLSLEPLIGPLPNMNLSGIDLVIVGGESGHKARLVKEEWILDIKKQCDKQNVKFFFKQWGKKQFNPNPNDPTINKEHQLHAKGGCHLKGKVYRAMPDKYKSK